MNTLAHFAVLAAVSVVGTLILTLMISYPAMLLWNACMVPAIPALAEIGWMQAWGIIFLINIVARTNLKLEAQMK